ncbi:c-5 sterol desaturase [Hypoxylon texense]
MAVPADGTCAADVDKAVASVSRRFRKIDILINNAGMDRIGSIVEEKDFACWRRVFECLSLEAGLANASIGLFYSNPGDADTSLTAGAYDPTELERSPPLRAMIAQTEDKTRSVDRGAAALAANTRERLRVLHVRKASLPPPTWRVRSGATALALAEESPAAIEREEGRDDEYTRHQSSVLANFHAGAGGYAEALAVHRVALQARQSLFGGYNSDTLNSCYAAALCLCRLGRHEEARRVQLETARGPLLD